MNVCMLALIFPGCANKIVKQKTQNKQRYKQTSHDDKVVRTEVSRQLPNY